MSRPWTAADDEAVRAHYPHQRRRARLAAHLRRSLAALRMRASRLGVCAAPPRRWTGLEDALLLAGHLPEGRTWNGAAAREVALWRRRGVTDAEIRGAYPEAPWTGAEDMALFSRRLPSGRSWAQGRARACTLGLA